MRPAQRAPLPFEALPGAQLSAVTFVMGDVRLHFDGPILPAHTWPVVRVTTTAYRRGDKGYRDALCARIARTVAAAAVADVGDEIEIAFDDGARLAISLRPEDRVGPEAAEFHDPRGRGSWVF